MRCARATVNTAHVAQAGDSAFCARLLEVKRQAIEHPLMSNDVFSSVVALFAGTCCSVSTLGAIRWK